MFKFIKKFFKTSDEFGTRSPGWKKVRDKFIKNNPTCAACGTKEDLEVHHITPYHVDKSLELDQDNLITLCGKRCHYVFGHFCDWKSWNENVVNDTLSYNLKRISRPTKNI